MTGGVGSALGRAWHYARIMRRASRMGSLFPMAGRLPPVPAPGGSSTSLPPGGGIRRLRQEHRWLVTTTHRLPVQGLDRPVEILHLTDLHLRQPEPWLDDLCARLSDEPPVDLVAITGDVVTRAWHPEAVDQFLAALPHAPLGRWAVMGNWEYWSDAPPERWRPVLAAHDVRLLLDEWVDLGPLVLAGTDDMLAGTLDLQRALSGRPEGRPTAVMTHSPACFDEIARPGVDLVLSGHTHGGQVRLPGLGALWVPRGTGPFVSGWYTRLNSHLFVSRGVGWSIAPLRAWCTPELARIRLLPQEPVQNRQRQKRSAEDAPRSPVTNSA